MTGRPVRERTVLGGLSAQRWRPTDDPGNPEGDRPGVLLIHGAMDRAESFARTARRLAGREVVAVDRRGYAGSVGRGPADLAGHAADVATVLDELGGRWVVVGHSIGGTVALAAWSHPGVVALGTWECPAPWLDGSAGRVGGGTLSVAERDGPAAAAEHFFRRMVGDDAWDRLGEDVRSVRRAEGPALVAELADLASGREVVDAAAVGVRVTVGLGDDDGDLARQAALLAAATGSVPVRLEGAPHGVHLVRPDAFAGFVGAVGAPSPGADGERVPGGAA